MSDTTTRNPLDIDESSDSLNSVISDYEEEGEAGGTHELDDSNDMGMDSITDDVESNNNAPSASEEIVAAVAKHIEVIEEAMRQHQSTGTSKFVEDEAEGNDPSDQLFKNSLTDDMLQDPTSTFAASSPSEDRAGLFALLNA